MGVPKLVCSHLQLRHLMLLSQTEEPEVYPLSTAILEAEIPFFGPIRSFYSDCPKYWPYLFGPCTFVLLTPQDGHGDNVNSFLPQTRSILKRFIQETIKSNTRTQ